MRPIATTRFGTFEAAEDRVISFPLGLVGFADAKAFVNLDHRPGSAYRWFQAISFPDLAFVVIDVLSIVPDYPIESVRKAL